MASSLCDPAGGIHQNDKTLAKYYVSSVTVLKRLMEAHKFKLGELVDLVQTPHSFAASGPYEIVRLLPEVGRDPQYRIKSRHDQHERVVKEPELTRFFS
jgi:hypothetical protein